MTEIEFLVQVLLTESVGDGLKEKLLKRIEEVEKERVKLQPYIAPVSPIAPSPSFPPNYNPWITYGTSHGCAHEYEPYGYHTGDFSARRCKKCQQSEPIFSGAAGSILSGYVTDRNTTSGATGLPFVNN